MVWCIWRERNARTFEDCEQNVLALKMCFFRTLFDWMSATALFSSISFLEFFFFFFFLINNKLY
jgi:hypothetical protein